MRRSGSRLARVTVYPHRAGHQVLRNPPAGRPADRDGGPLTQPADVVAGRAVDGDADLGIQPDRQAVTAARVADCHRCSRGELTQSGIDSPHAQSLRIQLEAGGPAVASGAPPSRSPVTLTTGTPPRAWARIPGPRRSREARTARGTHSPSPPSRVPRQSAPACTRWRRGPPRTRSAWWRAACRS